jgi:plasmid stabilization system protein ParE
MASLVNLSDRAERDLAQIYRQIDAGDSDAAMKWYRGFKEAILNPEELPNRCPVTPENKKLRHLLYGTSRTCIVRYTALWKRTKGWKCSIFAMVRVVNSRGPM